VYIRNWFWVRVAVVAILVADCAGPASAVNRVQQDPWSPLSFLVGEWEGEGSGKPGQGSGGFTFTADLQGKVLVRKNYAEYPATKERPAFRHDDLMIVYRDDTGKQFHAIYFDSENHTISYGIKAIDSNTVEFLSEASPATPRYRLTYHKTSSDTLSIKFEIAPAGKPDSFATYIEAVCRRKSASAK
jgi:hypothetical protein